MNRGREYAGVEALSGRHFGEPARLHYGRGHRALRPPPPEFLLPERWDPRKDWRTWPERLQALSTVLRCGPAGVRAAVSGCQHLEASGEERGERGCGPQCPETQDDQFKGQFCPLVSAKFWKRLHRVSFSSCVRRNSSLPRFSEKHTWFRTFFICKMPLGYGGVQNESPWDVPLGCVIILS